MRMVLEVVMLLGLVGGLFFVMNVLAKEGKENIAASENPTREDVDKPEETEHGQ